MKKTIFYTFLVFVILANAGCARLREAAKTVWGSSTKALEEARTDAVSTLFTCSYDRCFDEVLAIAKKEKMTVFIENRKKSQIVLMGIPQSINTTEVGVFFLSFGTETKIEITSLSRSAKDKAAEILFDGLRAKFKELK